MSIATRRDCRSCGETKPAKARGLCPGCYSRHQRAGDLDVHHPIPPKPLRTTATRTTARPARRRRRTPSGQLAVQTITCPGCRQPVIHYARGMCSRCYDRRCYDRSRKNSPALAKLGLIAQLLATPDDPDWRKQAACASGDPEDWYAKVGERHLASAVRTCQECPVRVACLRDAIQRNDVHGLWGGQTSRQRRAIRNRLGGKTISA